jgi:hypothetical protein
VEMILRPAVECRVNKVLGLSHAEAKINVVKIVSFNLTKQD